MKRPKGYKKIKRTNLRARSIQPSDDLRPRECKKQNANKRPQQRFHDAFYAPWYLKEEEWKT